MSARITNKPTKSRWGISKVDPCMGCESHKKCSDEKLICLVMKTWLASNKTDSTKPKEPNHKYYKQIYGDK